MCIRREPLRGRILLAGLGAGLSLIVTSSMAHAHGGMASADDLGPPLLTSVALAFACYWIVILWPSSKRKEPGDASGGNQTRINRSRSRAGRSSKIAAPPQTSQLRKVTIRQSRRAAGSERKTSDV